MKAKSRFVALIIATCLVVASSIGIIAWALAVANVGIGSKLSVTYEVAPHVVCTASATYQKKTDTSATPFQSGTITMNYGDTSGSRTLNASNSALVLNDTNTYVVFEFTFTNNNKMNTMGINITLTDNGTCKNMTRKYYFGDLSSSTIAQKESTIKSNGIDNSALSSTSTTLKQNQTTRIYMLLEITPGVIADYKSNDSNQFLFNLTSVEVTPDKVSYLSADWADRVLNAMQNASAKASDIDTSRKFLSANPFSILPDSATGDILGAAEPGMFAVDISIINYRPSGYSHQISVGTNSETSTSAYTQSNSVEDVVVYWDLMKISVMPTIKMFFYSSGTLFAPENSNLLFSNAKFIELYKVAADLPIGGITNFDADFSKLDISKVTNFSDMFGTGDFSTNITYPVGFPEEYK